MWLSTPPGEGIRKAQMKGLWLTRTWLREEEIANHSGDLSAFEHHHVVWTSPTRSCTTFWMKRLLLAIVRNIILSMNDAKRDRKVKMRERENHMISDYLRVRDNPCNNFFARSFTSKIFENGNQHVVFVLQIRASEEVKSTNWGSTIARTACQYGYRDTTNNAICSIYSPKKQCANDTPPTKPCSLDHNTVRRWETQAQET